MGTENPTGASNAAPFMRGRPSRVNGIAAITMVGDLVTRFIAGDGWDFAVFGPDDDLLLSASSDPARADVGALRTAARAHHFAGVVLPHVSAPSNDDRRCVDAVFGRFTDRLAILRTSRERNAPAYATRNGKALELFLRQYGEVIMAAVLHEPLAEDVRPTSDHEVLAFVVDSAAQLVGVPEDDTGSTGFFGQLMPADGSVAPLLHPIVADLIARYNDGLRGDDLVITLPFARVRLIALLVRGIRDFIVTLEPLHVRGSLEEAATRFAISKRELQVLFSMLRGSAVSEIANELSISESTVVFHLKRMLKKTGSRNRTELSARMLGWDSSL